MTENTEAQAQTKKERKALTEGALLGRMFKTASRLSPESRKALKAYLDVDSGRVI